MASVCSAAAPKTVSGKVFLDANGNGKLDAGEKGLVGVRVTDSVKFVVTGADGSYKIDVSDDEMFPQKGSQVVSVSWPSGHWPVGQWWARLDQIKDVAGVDFALREDKETGPFIFAHITDDHSSGGVVDNWGKNFPMMGQTVKFTVETGDMGYATPEGAEKMFSDILKNGRTLPAPIFYVPGNHDYVGVHQTDWSKPDPQAGGGAYTRHLGPVRWSFDYRGAHFVGIDWVRPEGGKIECGIPDIALAFLKADLDAVKAGTTVFAFVHFPNIPPQALQPQKFAAVYVFGGHSHSFASWEQAGGKIINTTQIALWGAGACGLVHVDGGNTEFLYRCAGCKWGDWKGMAQRGQHLNFCPLFDFAYKVMPQVEKLRQPIQQIADKPLGGTGVSPVRGMAVSAMQEKESPEHGRDAHATVDVAKGTSAVLVEAEIAPGAAKTMGLKLCGDRALETTWDGKWLTCDGMRVPMPLREWEKSIRIRLTVSGGVMVMQVNGMYQFARPLKDVTKVQAVAAGGAATLKTLNVFSYDAAKIKR
ncbi:MAG: metallophosphoesterase [Planctomycetaceae bacterium]|nr:metallophosphoesterase [Planctomycetaceae bacterium]